MMRKNACVMIEEISFFYLFKQSQKLNSLFYSYIKNTTFLAQSLHMSSTVDTLNNISLKIPIYIGFTELVVASVGNGLTIIIFRKKPLRSTRTAPYIMILAITNIIYLTHALLTRGIAALHNQFDATFGNDILCRFRSFMPYTFVTIIMSLLSWIAFDRQDFRMYAFVKFISEDTFSTFEVSMFVS